MLLESARHVAAQATQQQAQQVQQAASGLESHVIQDEYVTTGQDVVPHRIQEQTGVVGQVAPNRNNIRMKRSRSEVSIEGSAGHYDLRRRR
jgi:hypothetical protein